MGTEWNRMEQTMNDQCGPKPAFWSVELRLGPDAWGMRPFLLAVRGGI
jgi:hypothetical protein